MFPVKRNLRTTGYDLRIDNGCGSCFIDDMSPKELFLTNKEMADQLRAVTNAHWFKICLAFATAQLMENSSLTADQVRGASLLESTLMDLPEQLPDAPDMPVVLNHNVDDPRPKHEKPKEQPKPTS